MIDPGRFVVLAAALLADAVLGDPPALWRRVPHPVVFVGLLVDALDRSLNRPALTTATRKALGALALLILVAASAAVGLGLERLFAALPFGFVGTIVVTTILLAGRSLDDHVAAVSAAFREGGLVAARQAVSRIVGRDPHVLDEAGVSRAAIESLAENFSDGVVAPALWFAILGLPGLLAYKAVNTADSMIGHRSERHRDFGWAAARFDDLVNIPASRLAGLLIALAAPLAGTTPGCAFAAMWADAGKHRSPNAGWPEAAMAAAIDVALAGPRSYHGTTGTDPFIHPEGRTATAADIGLALRVYRGAWGGLFGLAALSAVIAAAAG